VNARALRGRLPQGSSILLIPAAALLVHQARYMLAYGSASGSELAAQGHSYQHSLIPWTVFALGIGLWMFLQRAVRTLRTGEVRLARASAPVLWALTTVGLSAIYVVQESLEELYAAGHPTGTAGVVGHGGWWAFPAAAVVAVAVVAVLRLGRRLLVAAQQFARRPLWVSLVRIVLPLAATLVRARPLASSAAGRAPPRRR
jgi:hypothetical protein